MALMITLHTKTQKTTVSSPHPPGFRLPPACSFLLVLALCAASRAGDANFAFQAKDEPARLEITIGGDPWAWYVYEDPMISRPYFAHVKAPGGIQVTRHHPPREGIDRTDHPTYHPGMWMAFGDISGSDYWRLKARVKHVKFLQQPQGGENGSFAVENAYLAEDDPEQVVCRETARYTIRRRRDAYLLTWDSTFTSDREFAFGDQEELGLGIRVATEIGVETGNGMILDAHGNRNGKQVRGSTARWCEYSGTIDGKHAGLTILCHPHNFRPSWYHARDYGFLAANPFGREALGGGAKSSVTVQPGESMRLRYGVLIHAGQDYPDVNAEFDAYVGLADD